MACCRDAHHTSHHLDEVLTHMNQVDPEVLAELPPELQQEVRAALLGKPKPRGQQPGAAAAVDGWGAAAVGGDNGSGYSMTGAEHQQRQQQVGLGRKMWGPYTAAAVAIVGIRSSGGVCQREQQQQLFAEEPVGAILAALQSALDALAPAPAPAAAAAAEVADEGSQHDVMDVNNPVDPVSCGDASRKLLVLAEYLVQWMVSHDEDLDAVRRVLREMVRAGQQRAQFRVVAERGVGVVQQHVQDRFGFTVRL